MKILDLQTWISDSLKTSLVDPRWLAPLSPISSISCNFEGEKWPYNRLTLRLFALATPLGNPSSARHFGRSGIAKMFRKLREYKIWSVWDEKLQVTLQPETRQCKVQHQQYDLDTTLYYDFNSGINTAIDDGNITDELTLYICWFPWNISTWQC